MSTRKRKSTMTITTAATPLTPEQIQLRDRIKELEAIGVKNHHGLATEHPNNISRSGGLWFPAAYLPDDLKAELEALKKKAA